MTIYPPRSWPAVLSLIALMVLVLGVDAALVAALVRSPVDVRSFVISLVIAASLALLAALGYWLWGIATLHYTLDRNALVIYWAGSQSIIPLPSVIAIAPAHEAGIAPRVEGLRWLGYQIGHTHLPEIGKTLVFASRPFAEQVIIKTTSDAYALSPGDPNAFIEEVGARLRLGPTDYVVAETRPNPWLGLGLWRDRLAYVLIGIAAVGVLALFAWVSLSYAGLPESLFFGVSGLPLPRASALFLPTIGLIALLGNLTFAFWVYRRQPAAAYLALGGTVAVQVVMWIAALRGLL